MGKASGWFFRHEMSDLFRSRGKNHGCEKICVEGLGSRLGPSLPGGELLAAEAGQVVGLGAVLAVAHQELSSVFADEAVVLVEILYLHLHLEVSLLLLLHQALFTLVRLTHHGFVLVPLLLPAVLVLVDLGLSFMGLGLQLQPEEPTAVLAPAETTLFLIPERVQLVVKRYLHAGRDVYFRKYADPGLASHVRPLLRLAVGGAAVINETRVIGLLAGVYHQPSVESEHVEIGRVILVGFPQPLPTHGGVQNLANVLHHEIPRRNLVAGLETPPPGARVEGRGAGVLAAHHSLVLAERPHGAGLGVALYVAGPAVTKYILQGYTLVRVYVLKPSHPCSWAPPTLDNKIEKR